MSGGSLLGQDRITFLICEQTHKFSVRWPSKAVDDRHVAQSTALEGHRTKDSRSCSTKPKASEDLCVCSTRSSPAITTPRQTRDAIRMRWHDSSLLQNRQKLTWYVSAIVPTRSTHGCCCFSGPFLFARQTQGQWPKWAPVDKAIDVNE